MNRDTNESASVETPPASILAVDDTPANLTLLSGILKERGYRVRPVPGGELALEAATTDPPDLVLLDISMPEMDGFEVCARLKAEPRTREIPVIFLTAHTDVSEKVKAFAVGGVDYVTKPFQSEEIHARVATHLELCRQKRELRESYEHLAALEKMRDGLVHMIVHDLRSPLGAICGLLEFLTMNEADLPADSKQDLSHCLAAAKKMIAMVTAVLDVSKMEAGAMRLDRAPFDLAAVTREVVKEMRGLATEHSVLVEPAAGAVPLVGDATLLGRVVQNLLGNALRFTPAGGTIRVVVELVGHDVRTSVIDAGPGVPDEQQARIFEKFAAVGAAPPARGHSTGLGLAFCRMAVEAHGGSIGVGAAPGGGGSTFWFSVPAGAPG